MRLKYLLYRPTMRLLHRFNLHYAPPVGPPRYAQGLGGTRVVIQHHWCEWCGLRGDVVTCD